MPDLAETVAYSAGEQPESILKNRKAEDLQGPRASEPIHELDWLALYSLYLSMLFFPFGPAEQRPIGDWVYRN